VSIGRDAIIGALALVNQDIPPLAVAYGQPARVVRFRDGR
jgi:acetyltransferase-like isoleucine patch superfamily enzyme